MVRKGYLEWARRGYPRDRDSGRPPAQYFQRGMPFLGATRISGLYRMAKSLALLDSRLRGVGPDQALGGRVWDSYSWHTDLPPGHPMVTGQQTVDFEPFTLENARLVTLWGMNWIATKMPDAH